MAGVVGGHSDILAQSSSECAFRSVASSGSSVGMPKALPTKSRASTELERQVEEAFEEILESVQQRQAESQDSVRSLLLALLHGQVWDRVARAREMQTLQDHLSKGLAVGVHSTQTGSSRKTPMRDSSWASMHNRKLLHSAASGMPQLKPRTRTQSVEGAFRDTSEGSIESVEPKAKRSWGAGPPVNTRIVPEADCSADLPYKRLSRRRSFCREAALDEGVQFSCFVGKMLSKLPEEQVEEPVVEPTIPRLLQFSQWMLLGLLKACGISAFGSSEEQPRIFIKAYHCLLILMFIAAVAFAAVELVSCRLQSDLILSRFCFDDSGPATDLAVFSGALGVLIYSGGWCYSARRAMLRETTEVLAVLMQDQGLASAWARTTGRDAIVAVVIWLALALSRIVRTALLDRRTYASILSSVCFVASGAVLASSGFLQMLTWRGLGIKIQSFIQPFLNEEINCQAVKTRWRVMGSCMHQASKTFQVVSTVMGMTTVLGSLAFLYDLQQSLLLASLPGFLVPVDAGFPATSSIHWGLLLKSAVDDQHAGPWRRRQRFSGFGGLPRSDQLWVLSVGYESHRRAAPKSGVHDSWFRWYDRTKRRYDSSLRCDEV